MSNKETEELKHELVQLRTTWTAFTESMWKKLKLKASLDWRGWNEIPWKSTLKKRLLLHVMELFDGDASQAIDIANYAMFLEYLLKQEKEKVR